MLHRPRTAYGLQVHHCQCFCQRAEVRLSDKFVAERRQIRDTLGQHYLGIGSVLVQRLALPSAEDYNAKACVLDPESGGCRDLQSLIIQARISRGIGY